MFKRLYWYLSPLKSASLESDYDQAPTCCESTGFSSSIDYFIVPWRSDDIRHMIYHHVQCSGLAGFCVSLESLSPHAECVGGGGRRFQLWRPPRGSARVQGGGSRESRRMLCSEGSGKRWAACLVWGKISLQEYAQTQLWNGAFTAKLYTVHMILFKTIFLSTRNVADISIFNTRTGECKHSIEIFYIVYTNLYYSQWFYFQRLFYGFCTEKSDMLLLMSL